MTTKKWSNILGDVKFKMYIPDYRIGFIVNNKQYNSGAFGIVILKFQEYFDIEIIYKDKIFGDINEEK